VIIWHPAKQSGIFGWNITEAVVKRASTTTMAVPLQQELHWLP